MNIENEHTFKRALAEGVNLFLGAGFSILAKDDDGRSLPTGAVLASELAEKFKVQNASQLNLPQLCTILEHSQKNTFYAYLKRRFSVEEFDPRYHCLDKINIKAIFATNVDDLLYKVYASSTIHYLNDLDVKGPAFGDRTAIDIVSLHGSVLDDNRPLSFSTLDIAAAFRTDLDRWHFLTQRIQAFPTLFWGYGMADSATLEALSPRSVQGRPHKDKWIVISEPGNEGALQYYQALGFQIIVGDTSETLEYLQRLPVVGAPIRVPAREASTRELFPQEAIPDIGMVPVRPIIEFYLGAAPSWHDIFSGRLHRTSHFAKIRDSINSEKHTVVIGLPACGKSTLMMQIAQEMSFPGHKLVCESPSIEKARLIITKLSGERALIFIDNFTDYVDSFEYFLEHPNVLIAAFDRDYHFDIVSHRIDRNRCQILDVTELSDADIQEIRSRVPPSIKSTFFRPPEVAEGRVPSIFEVIESSIVRPSLRTRFRGVIEDLAREDENLLDLLLACCYVHRCRTPISMDMLIAFFRDRVSDYNDIYRMCDTLGAMLSDYVGELADSEQDYFVPRSTIVSESIIDQAPGNALRRVLGRFHKEVSSYRIHRYDIFRRQAYDADLMRRAFPDWQEGLQFYEDAHIRDPSPYLRQQGALYLTHRRRFKEAFSWIDEAIMQSGGRNQSIRNSHAIILFRANIDLQETDGTVQRTLKQSMDILSECYAYDKRKTYHALTFADQALKYWDVYADDAAHGYLATAKKWLEEERERSPWNRNVKRLLADVSKKLAR